MPRAGAVLGQNAPRRSCFGSKRPAPELLWVKIKCFELFAPFDRLKRLKYVAFSRLLGQIMRFLKSSTHKKAFLWVPNQEKTSI